MSVLKINDVDIKDPQTMTWDIYDLDSENGAGRNQQGKMFRDRVAIKRKLTCTWGPLDSSEMSTLLSAMTSTEFSIEYPDALTGARRTMTAYVGDRSVPCYMYNPDKGKWLWQGLSANFIEV